MKRILVTGAGGVIGLQVIKYLLAEGKYEITGIDLKNKNNFNKLKKFKNRINILYGDINNKVLMEALVKDQDVIIHLATSPLPLANMKRKVPEVVDYNASALLIKCINKLNPKCHLFYASTTALYGNSDNVTINTKVRVKDNDYYNYYKYKIEELIKSKLKNYTIYRFPLVLSDLRYERFYWFGKKEQKISFITKEDAAYSIVRGINYINKLNQKTFNVVDEGEITYQELVNKLLSIYGITSNYLLTKIFIDKDYSSPLVSDGEEIKRIVDYQNDTLDTYLTRLKRRTKKRKGPKFLAKFFIRSPK